MAGVSRVNTRAKFLEPESACGRRMALRCHYVVLGVERTATDAELTKQLVLH